MNGGSCRIVDFVKERKRYRISIRSILDGYGYVVARSVPLKAISVKSMNRIELV